MSARRETVPDARPVVTVFLDGQPLAARSGEPVATALLCAGVRALRESPSGGTPRGAFCFMGVCQECAVEIDGLLARACMTAVREGMDIRSRGAPL